MANEIAPTSFLRADEVEQGLEPSGGFGAPVRRIRRGKNRKTTNGRDKLEMAQIKAAMTAMWRDGDTYVEIASQITEQFNLGPDECVTPSSVSYHIKTLLDTARRQSILHINERQALVLARYDQLEMLITEAYFTSMQSDTNYFESIVKKARSKDRVNELAKEVSREKRRVEFENKKRTRLHKPLLKPNVPDEVFGELPDTLKTTHKQIKKFDRKNRNPAGDPRWVSMLIDINDKRAKLWGLLNRSDISNPDQELAQLSDEERTSRMSAVLHAAITRRTGDTGALADPSPLGGFKEEDRPIEVTLEPEVIDYVNVEVSDDPDESHDDEEWWG